MPLLATATLEPQEPLPGWRGRFFNTEAMTFGYYDTVAGADLHGHAHPNEEIWHVIAGELEVTIGNEVGRAGPGDVAIIPPNTPHSVKVLTPGRVIVVDHPRRENVGGASTN